ncbi:MAG: methionyl-tRNA formyltransferase [Chloroflexi bacterium]|nr:methionyl-tRNA formyltransferase [Chloroflexota bacterium]
MGTPAFALAPLRAFLDAGFLVVGVVTQPDRPAGRGQRLAMSPVKQLALERGLPLLQPERLRFPEAQEAIRAWQPEVIVAAAYGQLIPDAILAIPPKGCLNLHPSLLPRWRGASPVPAAILHGDAETGVTVMLIDRGLDTGPILAQRSEPIREEDNALTLAERLSVRGAQLLVEVLPRWLRDEVTPQSQDQDKATYAPALSREQGLIDWRLSAAELWRRCRAFYPWPGCYTFWRGQMLKVLDVGLLPMASLEGPPGRVQLATIAEAAGQPSEVLVVAAGEGALALRRVQLAGRRVVSGLDLVQGYPAIVGSILGQ